MMRLLVNFKFKRRVKYTCSRHPRYSPERNGQAGILGGCLECGEMFTLYRAKLALESAVRQFEDLANKLSRSTRPPIAATSHTGEGQC